MQRRRNPWRRRPERCERVFELRLQRLKTTCDEIKAHHERVKELVGEIADEIGKEKVDKSKVERAVQLIKINIGDMETLQSSLAGEKLVRSAENISLELAEEFRAAGKKDIESIKRMVEEAKMAIMWLQIAEFMKRNYPNGF